MENVKQFLEKYGVAHVETEKEVLRFLEDAKEGLKGGDSSLAMIPSYIDAQGKVLSSTKAVVIDAGGTNLRVGLAEFDPEKGFQLTGVKKRIMPGVESELTAEAFFAEMAAIVEPYAREADRIGFCFSFPSAIGEDMDGEIIHFNKEIKITGAEGLKLGVCLKKALRDRGLTGDYKVAVLNDTVAALLGGVSSGRELGVKKLIGFILGTGLNVCYEEDTVNIRKLGAYSAKSSMCVNMEAGGYAGFARTVFEEEADNASDRPGEHKLEKMMSGAYQGACILSMLKHAAKDGLLPGSAEALLGIGTLRSAEADAFCRDQEKGNLLADLVVPEEKGTVLALLDAFYDRVAKCIAVLLSAVLVLENGKDPEDAPTGIVADGSTFHKSYLLRPKVDLYMKEIAEKIYGQKYIFLQVEDGNMCGAATAALLTE